MRCSLGYDLMNIMKSNKPFIGVLLIQIMYAGRSLFAKAVISKGLNPYVFVAYRQAFATLSLAPFAYFFESNKSASLSLNLLCKIFFVSLCGITLSLNLDSLSMNYTSATFAVAITNIVPAVTFIMAVFLRMESISIKKRHGLAKIVGTVISLLGALAFVFLKGPPIYSVSHKENSVPSSTECYFKGDWLKGSLAAISSNIAWSLWIIMQGPIVEEYPALLRLTTLQTFFSSIQSAIWAVAAERNLSSWKLGWDVNLLSIVYCGLVSTGITYWLRIWIIEKKGPVFLAVFTPLALVITAFSSAILWKETLHWGSACGAVLLICGLYGFLWAKHEEGTAEKNDEGKAEKIEQKSDTIVENA